MHSKLLPISSKAAVQVQADANYNALIDCSAAAHATKSVNMVVRSQYRPQSFTTLATAPVERRQLVL